MLAVQFDADIQDRTIIIPAKEAALLPKKVKVILLADNDEQPTGQSNFDAIRLHTKGLRFSRAEANALENQ